MMAALALGGNAPAWSAEPAPRVAQAAEPENWFLRQIRKFRSYPYLDRAYRLMAQGRHADARNALESYLSIEPGDHEARLSYASLLYRERAYDEAIAEAERILRTVPAHSQALVTRAIALQASERLAEAAADFHQVMDDDDASRADRLFAARSLADVAIARSRPADALAAFELVAQLDTASAATYPFQVRRALVLHELKRLDDADAGYQRAFELAPGPAEQLRVLRTRGDLAAERGDFDTRRWSFRTALELAPDDAGLLRAMADTEAAAGDDAAAIGWLRKALAAQPSDDDRQFLADLLVRRKDYAGASAVYDRLLAGTHASARRFRLLMGRGHVRHAQGAHDLAIADFRGAVALRPAPDALTALANALDTAGDRWGAADALRLLVRQQPSAANQQRLGDLLEALGDTEGATRQLDAVAKKRESHGLHRRLGHLYAGRGETQRAIAHFERAAALGAGADVQHSLGVLHAGLGQDDAALQALQRAVAGRLPAPQRGEAWRQLARLHARQGRDTLAVMALRRSLEADPAAVATRRELAFALSRAGDHEGALEQFGAVARAAPGAQSELQLGVALKALRRTGEALAHLRSAGDAADELAPEARKQVFDELGELHAARGEREAAAEAWQRSLAVAADAPVALRLASVQRELGRLGAAATALDAASAGPLQPAQQALWWEETAHVYAARHDTDGALAALEAADKIAPSADRRYRIGQQHRNAGRADEALRHLEAAVAAEPDTLHYAESLAYAYREAARPDDAARMFEAALERDPARVELQQDLAYSYLHGGHRKEAADAFRRAIDLRYASLEADPARGTSVPSDLQRLRQEVTELERGNTLTLYHSYRDDEDGATAGGGGVIPSQGALEYVHALSPPSRGTSVELFARALWSAEPGRFSPASDSLQGGLGARVKPLADHDFYLSGERLVKIGSQGRDDWLLRASYGWSTGYALRPGQRSWNYTSVYLDAGYFTRDGGMAAYYGEARQGWTFNVNDRLLITPHVTVSGRHLDPDDFDNSYREGGAGVSLRYLFNESRHEAPRSSAELLVQYKQGIGRDSGAGSGWALTAVLRF